MSAWCDAPFVGGSLNGDSRMVRGEPEVGSAYTLIATGEEYEWDGEKFVLTVVAREAPPKDELLLRVEALEATVERLAAQVETALRIADRAASDAGFATRLIG